MSLTWELFGRMLREEWRLHEELFGGRRFAAFPVTIAVLAAGAFQLLAITGTSFDAVVAGLTGVVFFFGLQVGTIGLVGRDALRDVLGDVTLLVFSARTLPVSWTRLLAVFLCKDLVYYAAFFLAPLGLAAVPSALDAGVAPMAVALLWVVLVCAFALGVTLSMTLAGVATRSRPALIGLVAGVAVAVVATGLDPIAYTPYALYRMPSPGVALRTIAPIVGLAVLGPVLFRPPNSGGQRTAPQRFTRLASLVGDEHGVTTRALLEVSRSSGSVWKVLFSMGVLFGVTALLLREMTAVTGLRPSPGIAFGTLLGLGAFTTYNWVTQFDSADEYGRYPLSTASVFAGKRRAYLLLSVPAGLFYLAVAAVWYDPRALLVGVVVLPFVAVYVFGVTAYVAGLAPTDLLFDTPLFVGFGAALAALAVPLLVAALVAPVAPIATTAGAIVGSLTAAAVGVVLTRKAGPRWAARVRS